MSNDPVMKEYMKQAHRMQSAVSAVVSSGKAGWGAPKDSRVGINSCMANNLAIANLLIEKGVFTRDEYNVAVRDAMKKEADVRCDEAREILGYSSLVKFA